MNAKKERVVKGIKTTRAEKSMRGELWKQEIKFDIENVIDDILNSLQLNGK